jgi:hypothetical protein
MTPPLRLLLPQFLTVYAAAGMAAAASLLAACAAGEDTAAVQKCVAACAVGVAADFGSWLGAPSSACWVLGRPLSQRGPHESRAGG